MITQFERDVLVKLCQETSMAKAAHMPEHALVRRFPNLGHRVRKALKKLVSEGYVQRHPTRDEMTYQITVAGRDLCRELKEQASK